MSASPFTPLENLLAACLAGVGISVVYDLFSLLSLLLGGLTPSRRVQALARRLPALPSDFLLCRRPLTLPLLVLLDTLCALLCGVLLLLFVYARNDGVFRLYLLVGAAIGFAAARLTLGRLIRTCSDMLVLALRLLFFYTVRLPLSLLWRALSHLVAGILLPLLFAFLCRLTAPLYAAVAARRHLGRPRRLFSRVPSLLYRH